LGERATGEEGSDAESTDELDVSEGDDEDEDADGDDEAPVNTDTDELDANDEDTLVFKLSFISQL
jgi:hypothetical protein